MSAAYLVDPKLKEYATTDLQRQLVDICNRTGSFRAADRERGMKGSDGARMAIRRLEIQAHSRGYEVSIADAPIPVPFVARGYSTLRRADGSVAMQWEKTKLDDQLRAQAILQAFESAAAPLPRLDPIKAPKGTLKDLLNLYTFTDYHLGMRASKREGGVGWDTAKAEDTLVRAFEHMVRTSPPAETAFINQLGDFMHSDSLLPVTPTSGHVVDQDVIYSDMVEAAVRVLRRLVDFALKHHKKVVVLMAEGNHDLASSVWLRVMFKALYEREPRVTVIDTAQPFYAWQHGNTMLGFHHGHKVKNDALAGIFATRYRLMWGTSPKVYIHVGHRHHVEEKEYSGAKVIQHPTLAAADSHSVRGGWDSEREATVITYSAKFGQVGRNTLTPEMLDVAA